MSFRASPGGNASFVMRTSGASRGYLDGKQYGSDGVINWHTTRYGEVSLTLLGLLSYDYWTIYTLGIRVNFKVSLGIRVQY